MPSERILIIGDLDTAVLERMTAALDTIDLDCVTLDANASVKALDNGTAMSSVAVFALADDNAIGLARRLGGINPEMRILFAIPRESSGATHLAWKLPGVRWRVVSDAELPQVAREALLAARAGRRLESIRHRVNESLEQPSPITDAQRLRHSMHFLDSILTSAADAIYAITRDGTIASWNPAAEDLFGYRAAEALGRREAIIVPNTERADAGAIRERVLSGEPSRALEVRRSHSSGRVIEVSITASPIRDRAGGIVGASFICRDLTDRKRIERELRRASEDLARASRAKSDFLSHMTHEIRTPLTGVIGFAELIRDGSISDEERDSHLESIVSSGQHLLSLINDILDFAKIEAGKVEVEAVAVDLSRFLSESTPMLSARARAKGLEFVVVPELPLPRTIESDTVRLRQILVNLVGNAVKFSEKGQITLRVSAVPGEPEAMLSFEIEDQGVGMTVEQCAWVFDSFQQADSTTTRRFGGTGLGLAISRDLARLLGGDITVRSELGHGTTFRVTVTCGSCSESDWVRDAAQLAAEASNRHEVSGWASARLAGRVLFAEDGQVNQRLVAHVLRKMGLNVVIAENGRDAVDEVCRAHAADKPYDLVLMDMMMPVFDGCEATRELRRLGHKLPIVALTANATVQSRIEFREAGCDAFVTKPIDFEALRAVLGTHLPACVD